MSTATIGTIHTSDRRATFLRVTTGSGSACGSGSATGSASGGPAGGGGGGSTGSAIVVRLLPDEARVEAAGRQHGEDHHRAEGQQARLGLNAGKAPEVHDPGQQHHDVHV